MTQQRVASHGPAQPVLQPIPALEAELHNVTANLRGLWDDLRDRLDRICQPAAPSPAGQNAPADRDPLSGLEVSLRESVLSPLQSLVLEIEDVSRRLQL